MQITNEDNMQLMARYEDNFFDLAIVDPPYGIDMADRITKGWVSQKKQALTKAGGAKHKSKDWDNKTPNKKYYNELFRISKNQIIWGANYFITEIQKNNACWIVWDKNNGKSLFADAELAYTSFNTPVRIAKIHWCGSAAKWETGQNKIHPTQKPVKLYEWLLINYAKKGDKILDTHLGSGSIAIACHNLGFDLTACELDKEYFDAAMNRINNHKSQTRLF